jgi:hypothetical protein
MMLRPAFSAGKYRMVRVASLPFCWVGQG